MVLDKETTKLNLKMATPNELMHLFWECEETRDNRLYNRLKTEMTRRIKYDY